MYKIDRKLWKLQSAGDRLWFLANASAQQSATLGLRGLAVVAEETRTMAKKIYEIVEKALFEDEGIANSKIGDIAFMLNILALNSAVESHKSGWQGKAAAVCAEDIRNLAQEVAKLLDSSAGLPYSSISPSPKSRSLSVDKSQCFIYLDIGGVRVVELLENIKEICIDAKQIKSHNKLRGMDIPFIDGFAMQSKEQQSPTTYVLLQTPWAEQNKTYAVAANVIHLFYSPIGIPTTVPEDIPLAEYTREYWESENDMPFIFMDWAKMI
jgi:hypothetical protein